MCLRRCGHVPGKGVCLFFAGTCQRKGSVPFFCGHVSKERVCAILCVRVPRALLKIPFFINS